MASGAKSLLVSGARDVSGADMPLTDTLLNPGSMAGCRKSRLLVGQPHLLQWEVGPQTSAQSLRFQQSFQLARALQVKRCTPGNAVGQRMRGKALLAHPKEHCPDLEEGDRSMQEVCPCWLNGSTIAVAVVAACPLHGVHLYLGLQQDPYIGSWLSGGFGSAAVC